tara:strand:+ start:8805 stop:9782 length:978 start_codon:yes stop_codon:yes gene_type:complete
MTQYKGNKPNIKGLSKEKQRILKDATKKWKARNSGASNIQDPVGAYKNYSKDPLEKAYGKGSSWMVFGRDRTGEQTEKSDKKPVTRDTGYGSMPGDNCWIIDLVAGRQSAFNVENADGKKVSTPPNFFNDAARIYIAQKTNVDYNFRLVDGKVGSPRARSAIAIKADAVRIIGREGIKLVTGEGAQIQQKNSRDGSLASIKGIDLIAGNWKDPDLQPIPKGDNLIECIEAIYEQMKNLGTMVSAFAKGVSSLEQDLRSHIHIAPLFGPNSISPDLKLKAPVHEKKHLELKMNMGLFQAAIANDYFKYMSGVKPDHYILSKFNNTN